MRLKLEQKLAAGGAAFVVACALLLYCAAAGPDSLAWRAALLAPGAGLATCAAGLLFAAHRDLRRATTRITEAAREAVAGRLDEAEQRLAAGDESAELAAAVRAIIDSLGGPLKQLSRSGAAVDTCGIEMAASMKQLEATVVEQAASTNQVTATSKEIYATVQELAGTMRAVRQMASEAAALAGAGMESVNGINATMSELLEATAGISNLLGAISDRAAAITQVITAITNIADRTNLISVNAAIEAEKAGRQAAGFSVVAAEVRRLADQTAVAALDIEKIIGEMQAAVKEGVSSMARYAERARASSETVAAITGDLGGLIDYTRRLEPQFDSVNNGMQMQARAAGQMLEAMEQLAQTAARTRDSLAQFRDVAGHMRSAVQLLESEAERFSAGA